MIVPRLIWLSANDWANCSGRVARACNSTAGRTVARVWTLNKHPFGYPEDVTGPEPTDELREWCAQGVDWILSTGDGNLAATAQMRDALGLQGAKVATLQVGSHCRMDPIAAREQDAAFGSRVQFVGADLFRFYRDDEANAVPFLAPCESPVESIDESATGVCHSPSNPEMKGTAHLWPIVESECERAGVPRELIHGVSADEARRRRAANAVFVDQFCFSVGGYGQAAMEGLAAGCAVISHIRHVTLDVSAFHPLPPILHVENEAALRLHLRRILADKDERNWRREQSLVWATTVASPGRVAEFWWRHLQARE